MNNNKKLTDDKLEKVAGGQSKNSNNDNGGSFGESSPVKDNLVYCPTCQKYVKTFYVLDPVPDDPDHELLYCCSGLHEIR